MLGATSARDGEAGQTWSFRGSKSRNKVSVGEPAEGSLLICLIAPHVFFIEQISLVAGAILPPEVITKPNFLFTVKLDLLLQ